MPDALGMGHGAGYGLSGGAALLVHNIQISAIMGRFLANFQYRHLERQRSIPKVFVVDRYDIIKAAKSREVFCAKFWCEGVQLSPARFHHCNVQ